MARASEVLREAALDLEAALSKINSVLGAAGAPQERTQHQPVQRGVVPLQHGDFKMPFGKHKGLTVQEVVDNGQDSYFDWLVDNAIQKRDGFWGKLHAVCQEVTGRDDVPRKAPPPHKDIKRPDQPMQEPGEQQEGAWERGPDDMQDPGPPPSDDDDLPF